MSNIFNGQILAEKLSKLNNSQQSIETLSHWCIYHRKKAKQIVETWDKLLKASQKEQRVPFLYLANDILQNSRRKGSEFVNEFWKVLPAALKDVTENGGEHGKNVVSRLITIWEERKVFGSRGQSLKDEMLGNEPPPPLVDSNGKSLQSQPIKIGKKDAHSIRIKLAVGGMPEKVVTAFQAVHDEHLNEDATLNKCKAAVRRIGKMEKDVDSACVEGSLQGQTLANELQEQENILRECLDQLGSVEATRAALVAQLKEALQEQEPKLELVRTQMQVVQAQIEQARTMKQRLISPSKSTPVTMNPTADLGAAAGHSPTMIQTSSAPEPPPPQPVMAVIQTTNVPHPPSQPFTSFASAKTITSEEHRKAAAAVAAKLTASASSAQMLTSIISSLAAEEAASKNTINATNFTTSPPLFPPEKRPKVENQLPVSDMGNGYFANMQQQQQHPTLPLAPPQTPATSLQPMTQSNQPQTPFLPPPPPIPPPQMPVQQYGQSTGVMAGAGAFGFGSSSLPPPPPLPNNLLLNLARPAPQPQSQQAQPQQSQLHQPSMTTGFYQSPGIGFYGQSHQATTPPVPRP